MKAGVLKTSLNWAKTALKTKIKTIGFASAVTVAFTARGKIDDYLQKRAEEKKAFIEKIDNYQKDTQEVKALVLKSIAKQDSFQTENAKEHRKLFDTIRYYTKIIEKKTPPEPKETMISPGGYVKQIEDFPKKNLTL
jgi:hypothetical protein